MSPFIGRLDDIGQNGVDGGRPLPDQNFTYIPVGSEIRYEELDLTQPWTKFNIEHEPTTRGIQKFMADYKAILRKAF